jgi:hypothetical protein
MNTVEIDIPLLVGGLIALIWIRFRKPVYFFQVACQFVGTLWGQYSLGISWSLAKLVPFLAITTFDNIQIPNSRLFLPFMAYTIFCGLLSSIFWNIPNGVSFAYGNGRIWMQLATFLPLALTARNFAGAMTQKQGVLLMWKTLMLLGIAHGIAFLYQYAASLLGLPYIGISRAHGLSIESESNFAAFVIESGQIVLRPGGLAGEPKTVAVLFGIILLTGLIAGKPQNVSKQWLTIASVSILLSLIGFIGAFSTSCFIAFISVYLALVSLRLVRFSSMILSIPILAIIIVGSNYILSVLELPTLIDLMSIRTVDRLTNDAEMDRPVKIAIQIMSQEPLVLFFGTGIGGGSFRIMEFMKEVFEYSYSPNIGLVVLLFEWGLVGSLLLLLPYCFLVILVVKKLHSCSFSNDKWILKFLLILSLSAMGFMLSGSGIAIGYPLAVGSILGASQFLRLQK